MYFSSVSYLYFSEISREVCYNMLLQPTVKYNHLSVLTHTQRKIFIFSPNVLAFIFFMTSSLSAAKDCSAIQILTRVMYLENILFIIIFILTMACFSGSQMYCYQAYLQT